MHATSSATLVPCIYLYSVDHGSANLNQHDISHTMVTVVIGQPQPHISVIRCMENTLPHMRQANPQ